MKITPTFAILAAREKGGYHVMTTCRCERGALRLARQLSRVLHRPSRVYSTDSRRVYCGELKRWVSVETALVADGQLAQALDTLTTPILRKGLDQIQNHIQTSCK